MSAKCSASASACVLNRVIYALNSSSLGGVFASSCVINLAIIPCISASLSSSLLSSSLIYYIFISRNYW